MTRLWFANLFAAAVVGAAWLAFIAVGSSASLRAHDIHILMIFNATTDTIR